MTKQDFLEQLEYYLRDIDSKERQIILDDQEEYIREAMTSGRSEEEAVATLGSPKAFAQSLMIETKLDRVDQSATVKDKMGFLFGAFIAMLALAPLNILVMFVPFVIIVTLITTGWISSLSMLISAMAGIIFFFGKLIFTSVGAFTHLSAFFMLLGYMGLSVLTLIFMIWMTRIFLAATAKYLKWNLNFIKARS